MRELLTQARNWLAPCGRVLLELNTRQQPAAATHAAQAGFARPQHHDGIDGQTSVLDLLAA